MPDQARRDGKECQSAARGWRCRTARLWHRFDHRL